MEIRIVAVIPPVNVKRVPALSLVSTNMVPKLSIDCGAPPPAEIPPNQPGIRFESLDRLIGVNETVTVSAGIPLSWNQTIGGNCTRAGGLGTETVSPSATDTVAVALVGTSFTPRLVLCPDVTRVTGKVSENPVALP